MHMCTDDYVKGISLYVRNILIQLQRSNELHATKPNSDLSIVVLVASFE